MRFESKLRLRLGLSVLFLLLGISAFGLGILKNLHLNADFPYFYYYIGTGGGLIGVSIVMIKKNLSALAHKEVRQTLKVEEQDERNLLIAYKSGYFTFVATTITLYAVSLYLLFIGSELFEPIIFVCCALVGFYLLFYFMVRKST